jgi:hypothetical protein
VDNHDADSAAGEDNDDEEEAFDTSNYDFSSMPLSSIAATRTVVLERLTNKYQKRQPTTRLAPQNQNEILLLLLLLQKKHISQTTCLAERLPIPYRPMLLSHELRPNRPVYSSKTTLNGLGRIDYLVLTILSG